MRKLLHHVPKPILFGVLGALGCLMGWALGEPLLMTLKPPKSVEGQEGAAPAAAPVLVFNNEMQRRLKREEAQTGDIQISLMWNNSNDLDLHCLDPKNERIFYNHKKSGTGGELDVDMNAREPYSFEPVENIFWPPGGAPPGKYEVMVNYYAVHDKSEPTTYTVGIKAGGLIKEIKGTINLKQTKTVHVIDMGAMVAQAQNQRRSLVEMQGSRPVIALKTVVVLGLWTALLAIFSSLMLVFGQNLLMRRSLLNFKQLGMVASGGVAAGLVSGAVSQYMFSFGAGLLANKIPDATWILKIGQVFGWGLLGALMGFGMGFFIPNLDKIKSGLAGLIGGVLGAIGFLAAMAAMGELSGRFIGAGLLGFTIGLMVALVERLAREAALVVHWDAYEQTVINLGPEPVILGSGRDAHLYLPKEKGFPEVTATVFFKDGVVQMDNRLSGKTHTLVGGNKLEIGPVVIEIQTDA